MHNRLESRVLSLEIVVTIKNINRLHLQIDNIIMTLTRVVPEEIIHEFRNKQQVANERKFLSIKKHNQNKLKN